jgi:hypothetical protein
MTNISGVLVMKEKSFCLVEIPDYALNDFNKSTELTNQPSLHIPLYNDLPYYPEKEQEETLKPIKINMWTLQEDEVITDEENDAFEVIYKF